MSHFELRLSNSNAGEGWDGPSLRWQFWPIISSSNLTRNGLTWDFLHEPFSLTPSIGGSTINFRSVLHASGAASAVSAPGNRMKPWSDSGASGIFDWNSRRHAFSCTFRLSCHQAPSEYHVYCSSISFQSFCYFLFADQKRRPSWPPSLLLTSETSPDRGTGFHWLSGWGAEAPTTLK